MPRNAEAHFHLGLMHMRNGECDEALRAFQHCRQLYTERIDQHATTHGVDAPAPLLAKLARVRSHAAQAAHLTSKSLPRDARAAILEKLQRELVAATQLDVSQIDVWNSLALLHLNEGGQKGAREVLLGIRQTLPDYLDALNNLGLAELALGNEEAAISCFQKVILVDREHVEALSNYAIVLLRHGMYDAAIRSFDAAVDAAAPDARGLPFAWGGLAVARAALGQLDAAEAAARRAEQSASPANRARFAMLRTSIYARRVIETLRHNLPWNEKVSPAAETSAAFTSPSSPLNASSIGVRPDTSSTTKQENNSVDDVDMVSALHPNGAKIRGSASGSGAEDFDNVENEPNDAYDRFNQIGNGSSGQSARSDYDSPKTDYEARNGISTTEANDIAGKPTNTSGGGDARTAMDGAVLRLRALAREINSSSASTALGAVLRLRHECSMEESGNRNFGAEAAERLVEALESDKSNATAWVQLSLLQLGTGEYISARDFAVQGVSHDAQCEASWNALAVAMQLNDEGEEALSSYYKAVSLAKLKHSNHGEKIYSSKKEAETREGHGEGEDVALCVLQGSSKVEEASNCEAPNEMANATEATKELGSKASKDDSDMEGTVDEDEKGENQLSYAGRVVLAALYNNIGNMRRQEGHSVSEAMTAYEKSLRIGGENAIVYNNLALLYISTGRFRDASNMLDHALKLDPNLHCAISNRLKLTSLMRRKAKQHFDSDDELDCQRTRAVTSDDDDDRDNVDAEDEHDLGTDSDEVG